MTVVLPSGKREVILDHARSGAPKEVCGVLGGHRNDGEVTVEAVHPVANAADAPRTWYELDPEGQLEAIEEIEGRGGDVVGFYHSHPGGPAGPSPTDRAGANWPDAHYFIVSLAGDPSVGAWYWTGERFVEEAVGIE